MKIGELGPWTLAAARNRVLELRREVDLGHDPMVARRDALTAPDVSAIWRWYSEGALKLTSATSQRDITHSWKKWIEPNLGGKTKISALNRSAVQTMVDRVAVSAGKIAANRCHSYLRRALNLAKADGLIESNPASLQIVRHQEHPRQRFLSYEEIGRIMSAIDDRKNSVPALAVKFLLLTGARKGEVLSAQWADFDEENRRWIKPASKTKQRRQHAVPLSDEAYNILETLKVRFPDSEYVFPSKISGHIKNLKREWSFVCSKAKIENCRIHDLRHSFASVVVSNGASLEMVGALLGHTQSQTTQRYAHLIDSDLRGFTNLAGRAITGN